MINYNHEKLEKILGGELPVITEKDEAARRFARALTDSIGSENAPAIKFSNGMAWMQYQHEHSYELGKLDERKAWKNRIAMMFGL